DPVKITGQRLVRPDGTIGLGQLGSVVVAGRTLEEARGAVAEHLARRLDGFDPRKLTVDVAANNSKVFYVIVEADGGEQVYRFPATGGETVRDAIRKVKLPLIGVAQVPSIGLGERRVCLGRMFDDGQGSQMLRVDWEAITQDAKTATNYPLLPGDRVYILMPAAKQAEGGRRTAAGRVAGSATLAECEAVLK